MLIIVLKRLISVTCLLALISFPVIAQEDTIRGTNPTVTDSIAAVAEWVKSDTGRMMPGYRDLSGYDNPGMCLIAMHGVRDAIWRRGQSDTLPLGSPADTLPTAVHEIGQTCLAGMSPENVDSAQLFDLMAAALMIGDTALARATVVYHVSKITGGARERGFVFVDAMAHALASKPRQAMWAESLFPELVAVAEDSLAPINAGLRLRWVDAWTRFDTSALVRIGLDRGVAIRSLLAQGKIKDSTALGIIYQDSIDLVEFKRSLNFKDEIARVGNEYVSKFASVGLADYAQGLVEVRLGTANIYGSPAPGPLKMFRHYPASAPIAPIPGRVTFVGYIEQLGEGFMEPYLAALRRIHEKYHDRGLDIALIAHTKGFAWGSPPLNTAEEAKLIGWYYREHLKLPFTIHVAATEFGKLSDGRITRDRSAAFQQIGVYRYWRPHWAYIVGRDGTIAGKINRTSSLNRYEAELEAIIRRELNIQETAQK